jgi:uncharacterized protein with PIN domain
VVYKHAKEMTPTYKPECPYCDTSLIGFTREEFLEHVEEEHGKLKMKIWRDLVVSECLRCGAAFTSQTGHCPECFDCQGEVHSRLDRNKT